jgi:hypothetical protein
VIDHTDVPAIACEDEVTRGGGSRLRHLGITAREDDRAEIEVLIGADEASRESELTVGLGGTEMAGVTKFDHAVIAALVDWIRGRVGSQSRGIVASCYSGPSSTSSSSATPSSRRCCLISSARSA